MRKFLLLCLIILSFDSIGQWNKEISFEQLTVENGLSHNQISAIYEDKYGFIWIGTFSGLNKYDGYNCQTILHEDGVENALRNNIILWIKDGPQGNIWINTGEGISIYDPAIEKFVSTEYWLNKLGIVEADILDMEVDHQGAIWFVLGQKGLLKYSVSDESTKLFTKDKSSEMELLSNDVTDMSMDFDGDIWIIHRAGQVEVIDPEINKVVRKFNISSDLSVENNYTLFVDADKDIWIYSPSDLTGLLYLNTTTGQIKILDESWISSRLIRAVLQDKEGNIWVGTDHGGISLVNKADWSIFTHKNQPNKPGSISHNSITTMYEASNDIIWIGKNKNGVSFYNPNVGKFVHYKYANEDPAYNDMSSIAEDKDHNLWIGTNGKGLIKFDSKTKKMSSANLLNDAKSSIGSNVVVSLRYSSDNSLWIGTYLRGLFRYQNGKLTSFNHDGSENSISDNNIWSVYEDTDKNIWIGTLNSGLDLYNIKTGKFTNYNMTNELTVNYVTAMLQDDQRRLWIATGQGLTVHDMDKLTFKHYLTTDETGHAISSNSVTTLFFDSRSTLWVGTSSGLNKYAPEWDGFEVIREKDGLSSDIINAILEDSKGNLWLSTTKGISRLAFEGDQMNIQTFDTSDGLQGDIFVQGAALKTKDGMLVFSGQNGFNMIDPEMVTVSNMVPRLAFTKFSVNSRPVIPGLQVDSRMILEKNLNETEKVYLDHDQNSFAFEFSALTFDQAKKNKYEYKLEGFDQSWIGVSSDIRMANYTNLDEGHYTFRVRASNNHNTWNYDGLAMPIVIYPPIWKTPFAYFIYSVILIVIMYLTRKTIVDRERTKAKIDNERLNAQRMHELDMMKLKFFTNISHEFRTPISLVLTPIERMIKYPEKVKVTDYQLIQRNAKRLLTLVNQLLDFRKMEANQHKLNNSTGDLITFVKEVVDSFSDLSKEQNIVLQFESELEQFFTSFDKDKMDKILINLLSNAFKFTLPGGQIIVDVEQAEGERIIVSVTDTGIGIPKEKQDLVFERFIQSDVRHNMINSGTGIGLSITKEFVELHQGKITLESELDQGSTFSIEFPFKHLAHEEISLSVHPTNQTIETTIQEAIIDSEKPTVFLVEDNADFRFYLKDNLKQYYNVLEAFNGKEGWRQICQSHPDIVISDVMMPEMNGLELCKKIKNDPRTADIPVILLTAQSSDDSKIEGLESGAIEFISKPFNFEILVSTINSALKFQKRVNDARKKVAVNLEEIEIISRDEKLVTEAMKLVEENISNSDFSVEVMSHELGYSRGHLYQKMLKITGQTPMDFIRNIRMKRAAEYLTKGQLSVSEVAYKVGYNNPKLFSRYFKSQFKMYPSAFIAKHGKEN